MSKRVEIMMMSTQLRTTTTPLQVLRQHVTGAIERGESTAIKAIEMVNRETFPDGSTIDTDPETGNRTVFGVMAHKAYFERLRAVRISSNAPDVAVVAFCENADGSRKAELIRRRMNPSLESTFGPWGWETWTDADPENVTRHRNEQSARREFRSAMIHGTNGVGV